MLRNALLSIVLVSFAACASGSGGPRRVRDYISPEEIAAVQAATAFEVVQQLRPEFLRTRGSVSASGSEAVAVVYIDGVRAGSLQELRRVPREALQDVRYINAADATTRYGTGHGGGAIMVATKR